MRATLIRTAFRSLLGNRLRTALTLLGMVIGVAAVVSLMSIGQATTANVASRIQGLGTNLLVVTPGDTTQGGVSQGLGSAQDLTQSDVAAIEGLGAGTVTVAPDETTRGLVTSGSQNLETTIEGSTTDLVPVRNITLAFGRWFNQVELGAKANVAIIGPTTAENLFGWHNPVGQTVWVNGIAFQIIGEMESQGSNGAASNDDRLVIPLTTLQAEFTNTTSLNAIYVSATKGSDMQRVQNRLETILRRNHGLSFSQSDDFTITNQATLLSTLQDVSNVMQEFLGAIAGISLLVGGIGIMNIMLVTVTERTKEIGLRKALGARRKDILRQFLVESGIVGVIGAVIGILVGCVAVSVIGPIMKTAAAVDITSVYIAFAVAMAVALVFGIYPAVRASRLSPIHALRYE